jgi:hypothetical protein
MNVLFILKVNRDDFLSFLKKVLTKNDRLLHHDQWSGSKAVNENIIVLLPEMTLYIDNYDVATLWYAPRRCLGLLSSRARSLFAH